MFWTDHDDSFVVGRCFARMEHVEHPTVVNALDVVREFGRRCMRLHLHEGALAGAREQEVEVECLLSLADDADSTPAAGRKDEVD